MKQFTEDQLRYARGRIRHFAREWSSESPAKLHTSSRAFDEGGAPQFTADFRSYLDESLVSKKREARPRGPHDTYSPRRRVTEAFRVLRSRAPKEYDAVNCLVLIDRVGLYSDPAGEAAERQFEAGLRTTADKMNLSAIRAGDPVRLSPDDVLGLIINAVYKLDLWSG